jgi:hypothetical protein
VKQYTAYQYQNADIGTFFYVVGSKIKNGNQGYEIYAAVDERIP